MRLADVVFRRGHLSESALVEAWNTGIRPVHLDRCDICAERALEISHWLEDVKSLGRADADVVFTAERLSAQRGQILQRLEQLDRPRKVISFPARAGRTPEGEGRRVNARWLAAAAAAGLTLGVVSVELSHRLRTDSTPTQMAAGSAAPQVPVLISGVDAWTLSDDPYARTQLGPLDEMDAMTPRLVDVVAIRR